LESCLLQADEQHLFDKEIGFNDPFPENI